MTRAVTRKSIRTRSGVSEIRIERRAIGKVAAPAVEILGNPEPLPALVSLADEISRQLRNRIAFPADFWKGAVE